MIKYIALSVGPLLLLLTISVMWSRTLKRKVARHTGDLRESEERYRAISEDSPLLICRYLPGGKIAYVNQAYCKYFHRDHDELVGQSFLALIPEEDRQTVMANIEGLTPGSPTQTHEHRVISPDGEIRWQRWTNRALFDSKGKLTAYQSVGEDFTERKRAEEALKEARDAAEAASRAKSEFLARMSHEIRTPLNAIIGMSRLALETELSPEQKDYLEPVVASGEHLLSVINDILDLSKIEKGKLELDYATFGFRRNISEVIGIYAQRAQEKGLQLTQEIDSDVPDSLGGDVGRLNQVVINLVGNAVKFTEHGEVKVLVGLQSKTAETVTLRIAVADTGIGVPADKQGEVFEPFFQADSSTTRKYGGTGLGLAISRQLVALLGGQLWFESEPGKGSTFFLTVPLELVEPRGEEADLGLTPPRGSLRVLLAEDHPVNQKLAVALLEKEGYTVVTAEDGARAVELFESQEFDLVIMDIQMPNVDGLDATGRIRQLERSAGRHTPIIAMTAHALKGDRERFLVAGLDGYVAKPIQPRLLFETINDVVLRAQALEARRRVTRRLGNCTNV
jgi:PAS domain S-box-containing protein